MKRVSVNPAICHGKPCISGTRIMVSQVLDLVEAGKPFQEIIDDFFPDISVEDVRACIRFANDLLQNEDVRVVSDGIAA